MQIPVQVMTDVVQGIYTQDFLKGDIVYLPRKGLGWWDCFFLGGGYSMGFVFLVNTDEPLTPELVLSKWGKNRKTPKLSCPE